MKKQSKKRVSAKSFRDYLNPDYLVVCNDVIIGQDQNVSLIRLIDQIIAFAFPIQLARFVIVAQFTRNETLTQEDFLNAGLVQKLMLTNPSGESIDLGLFSPVVDPLTPWSATRTITDLSGQLSLSEEGTYTITLLGKTQKTDFEELITKRFPTLLSVGLPGLYLADFSSDAERGDEQKKGEGFVVLLPDGTIQGADGGYSYEGNYGIENDSVLASLKIRKSHPEAISIFGENIENLELTLRGTVDQDTLNLHGCVEGVPSHEIWVTLRRQTRFPVPSQSE